MFVCVWVGWTVWGRFARGAFGQCCAWCGAAWAAVRVWWRGVLLVLRVGRRICAGGGAVAECVGLCVAGRLVSCGGHACVPESCVCVRTSGDCALVIAAFSGVVFELGCSVCAREFGRWLALPTLVASDCALLTGGQGLSFAENVLASVG